MVTWIGLAKFIGALLALAVAAFGFLFYVGGSMKTNATAGDPDMRRGCAMMIAGMVVAATLIVSICGGAG